MGYPATKVNSCGPHASGKDLTILSLLPQRSPLTLNLPTQTSRSCLNGVADTTFVFLFAEFKVPVFLRGGEGRRAIFGGISPHCSHTQAAGSICSWLDRSMKETAGSSGNGGQHNSADRISCPQRYPRGQGENLVGEVRHIPPWPGRPPFR